MSNKLSKEEIFNMPEYKAAHNAFQNGCFRGLDLQEMAHYCFVQGIKFAKTGKIPELEF